MMGTAGLVYAFMRVYQEEHGRPPLLREIAARVEELNYRSSVRHDLVTLTFRGLVEEIGDPGTQRRWRAVE